jgi:hypothetical protein
MVNKSVTINSCDALPKRGNNLPNHSKLILCKPLILLISFAFGGYNYCMFSSIFGVVIMITTIRNTDEKISDFTNFVSEASNEILKQWVDDLFHVLQEHNHRVNGYIFRSGHIYHGPDYRKLKEASENFGGKIRVVSYEVQSRLENKDKKQADAEMLKGLKERCDSRLKMSNEIEDTLVKIHDGKFKRLDKLFRTAGYFLGVPTAMTAVARAFYPENLWAIGGVAITTLAGCTVVAYPEEVYNSARFASDWVKVRSEVAIRNAHQTAVKVSQPIRRKAIPASVALGLCVLTGDTPAYTPHQPAPTPTQQKVPLTTPAR